MKIEIEKMTYSEAEFIDKKNCRFSIQNKIIGDGFEIYSEDKDDNFGTVLTLGSDYMIRTIKSKETHYCVALFSSDGRSIVIKAGEI